MTEKVPPHQDPKILAAKFNPLADYKMQTTKKNITKSKRAKEFDISNTRPLSLIGIEDDDELKYREDVGQFEYAKLIVGHENRERIFSLKPTTQTVLLWALFSLRYRTDMISLNPIHMKRGKVKLSRNTFQSAINELISQKIIKRVNDDPKSREFWHFHIDPQVMFKGNAYEFYEDVLEVHRDYMKEGRQ